MEPKTRAQVFSVGHTAFTWDDVILHAQLMGDWGELERQTRAGLAHLKRHGEIDSSQLDPAIRDFRYVHNLLAADELNAWLERWGLEAEDWLAFLRRQILRAKAGPEPPDAVAEQPAAGAELEAALWAEGVCSGALERFARRLSERAAVAASVGVVALGRVRPPELASLDRTFREFCERPPGPGRVEREIDANRVEWLDVELELLRALDENVAREAALCVTSDGLPLSEVATRAGGEVERLHESLDRLEPELRLSVLGAQPGDLIGPVSLQGCVAVGVLRSKVEPSPEDARTRRRAEQSIVQRAIDREVADRVRWHEHL